MPKEITYSNAREFRLDADGNEVGLHEELAPNASRDIFRRGLQVGWSRDKYVEVGAAMFEVSTQRLYEGMFVGLDREGCNRMIRTLRKARDQAFGADA